MFKMFTGVEWGIILVVAGAAAAAVGQRSLLHMVLMAELAWVGLYLLVVHWGVLADSALLVSWALLFMCVAAAESAVGLGLILFRFALYGAVGGATGDSLQRRRGVAPLLHLND